ncbi:DUF5829 family protein [Aurantibacter sp.]|uniref:DUF5829 family protein n=1 Tax=Aurantibacter sp. TaxID=2807103 RepID=UPI003264AE90
MGENHENLVLDYKTELAFSRDKIKNAHIDNQRLYSEWKMKTKIFLLILSLFTITMFAQDNELKFNHMYFVVDSASFSKLKYDKKLNTLVNIDQGIPAFNPIDSASTTLYLRGKSTYVEIMGPDNRFKEKVGAIGLGFSWDTHDTINNKISKKLRKPSREEFISFDAKWNFGSNEVNWYTAFYTEMKGFISTWYAYYNPQFLSNLYQQDFSIFTRELFLEKAYAKNKPINDLSEITLNCTGDDFKKITTELSLFFFKSKKIKASSAVFDIGTVKLKLNKSMENKNSIKQLIFSTKEDINDASKDFGSIELRYKTDKIEFNFK